MNNGFGATVDYDKVEYRKLYVSKSAWMNRQMLLTGCSWPRSKCDQLKSLSWRNELTYSNSIFLRMPTCVKLNGQQVSY